MKVLALTKYDNLAASTRQRFVQYRPALADAGISLTFSSLLDNNYLKTLVDGSHPSLIAVSASYIKRIASLIKAHEFDALWIQYELFPYIPAFAEKLGLLWGKPLVFDFDDAFFHLYDNSSSRIIRRLLGTKMEPLLRRADVCICGNAYLAAYTGRFCQRSVIVPTVVDTDLYTPRLEPKATEEPLTIGWIGSPSTWAFMRPKLPILTALCRERGVRVRAVGAGSEAAGDRFPGLELIEWNESSEIEEVQNFDIGIMPVTDGPFERGKSGYKLIQYMACGLPVAASPVGVNSEIVSDGQNGFLAESDDQWRQALVTLIGDETLRRRFGQEGRRRAVAEYSLAAHAGRIVDLFRSLPHPIKGPGGGRSAKRLTAPARNRGPT